MKHQCFGKKAYSKKDAQTVINFSRKRFKKIFRMYQCRFCNLFHLTTQAEGTHEKYRN